MASGPRTDRRRARRPHRRPCRVAASLAALLAGVALSACGSAGGGALQPRHTPLHSIFEADNLLHDDPAGTLDLLRRLGVDTVRLFVFWGGVDGRWAIAPDPGSRQRPAGFNAADPAAYPAASWATYDEIVRDAQARGIGVDLTLGPPPPLWAQGPGDPGHPVHPQWRVSAHAFGQFVHAIATRYSGHFRPAGSATPLPRVDTWALWNEPNFGPMLAPQVDASGVEASAQLYRALVDAGWQALQATGHGSDTILIGELAPRGIALGSGPGRFGYMVPLRFLRALYCVDGSLHPLRGQAAAQRGCPTADAGSARFAAAHPGLFRAAGFAVHPYEFGPPNVATPDEPDFVDLATLPRFEQALDTITSVYGSSRRFPIYSTEFGYETNPPETVVGTVTPQLAAAYLNQSEYMSWRDPRLRTYDQYLLRDPPNGEFATGLEFTDGTPKPGLQAFRLPIWLPRTSSTRGSRLEVWGCARAADVTGSRAIAVQFRPPGGAWREVSRARSDADGYIDTQVAFPGSGEVRLRWTGGGETVTSRTVAVSLR